MCGIAGVIDPIQPPELIGQMTELLRHRGPDDSDTWLEGPVALGHRRLTIIDLSSAGRQPMTLGDLVIVYNGEIYNHLELRQRLGGTYKSTSDTEVILHLYAKYQDRCVEFLEGMFAFAIWDRKLQRLFAARDRLGVKPFLYQEITDGIRFASELPPLRLAHDGRIDRAALHDYFTYKYVPSPKTIYRNIRKLPPAHTLVYQAGKVRTQRYWQPESESELRDWDTAQARFEELLHDVVTQHTLADVPVGLFLSGGLDSTTLAVNLDRPQTFTLGFDIETHDEGEMAREVAEALGCTHREEVSRGGQLDEALDVVSRVFDEPFGDHSGWPVYQIARLAQRHVKVVMSGEGGDELFAGYHWYRKLTRSRAHLGDRLMAQLLPTMSRGARTSTRRVSQGLDAYAMFVGPFTPAQRGTLLTPDLVEHDYDDLWHLRGFWREDLPLLKRIQWADLHTYLPDDLLTKADRATMAVSLEARPPLVDHRLVEFSLSLAPELLHDGTKGKLLVRRHLEGRVPPRLLELPKSGFTSPIRRWLKKRPEVLSSAMARLANQGILRSARPYGFNNEQAWTLLVLDHWLQRTQPSL